MAEQNPDLIPPLHERRVPVPATGEVRVGADGEEAALVRALRDRDEAAFATVLDRHYSAMLRLAMVHVGSRTRAEEVVQETWLAVLEGVGRFEGRSSLKTWIFRILVNRARTLAVRESRMIPFSALSDHGDSSGEMDVSSASQTARGGKRTAMQWLPFAESWADAQSPEDWLLSRELRSQIEGAVEALPARQREVITLRDLSGWSADEVCNALQISETNQRVLLHRARVKVRDQLASYLAEEDDRTDEETIEL